jgi:hypothetical protein
MIKWSLCVLVGWPMGVYGVIAMLNGHHDWGWWVALLAGVFLTVSGGAGLVLRWRESRRPRPLPVYPPLRGTYPPPGGPPSTGPITASGDGWQLIAWSVCFVLAGGLLLPVLLVLLLTEKRESPS